MRAALLLIGDSVTFIAKRGICKLVIDGNITIDSNVSFIAEGDAVLEIWLNNELLQTTFNYTTFNRCELHNYGRELNINNSVFDDCYKTYSRLGEVTIDSTIFIRTWLYIANQMHEEDFMATITNCHFSTDITITAAIDIWNYQKFFINNNIIDGYYNGIHLTQSGEGTSGNQNILENEIMNCTMAGILSFNSTSSIAGNNIHNNNVGVRLYNYSNTDLIGNPGATTYAEAQQILNNDSYELHASPASFPWYMRHNVIIDSDNAGNPYDPLVYYSGTGIKDIRYNCWGNDNSFDPIEDLYPIGGYLVDPKWCPGSGGIDQEAAETLYLSAKAQYDTANYSGSKSTFEMVISQYPETKYANASMKDLFTVEKFVTNDYGALQQYYNTNTVIQADTVLTDLSVFFCQ